MEPQKKRILVVEDEVPMAEALSFKLKKAGFYATIAIDGLQAVSRLEKETFDLVLLDLILPNLDGFGVLDAVHKHKIRTPVIVLSNLNREEDIARAQKKGAKEYFVKANIRLNEFIERVKRMLNV